MHDTQQRQSQLLIKAIFVCPFWLQILFCKWSNKRVRKHAQTHDEQQTRRHKFSHSAEPFLKPGLIFVWIIGLCAYRLHHIAGLKPYYQPIEREKRFLTSTHCRTVTIQIQKDKHLCGVQQKHTCQSWNMLLHGGKKKAVGQARQSLRFCLIRSESCCNNCFSPFRENKQILLNCFWL